MREKGRLRLHRCALLFIFLLILGITCSVWAAGDGISEAYEETEEKDSNLFKDQPEEAFGEMQEGQKHAENGEKLVFENIPVGTRYVVEEAGDKDGYTPSVTVTENGFVQQRKTAEETQGISSAPDIGKDSLVGEGENKVVFENNYQEIAMTGIVMNNLPFILLVAVAAAAIGIMIIMKKKTSGK